MLSFSVERNAQNSLNQLSTISTGDLQGHGRRDRGRNNPMIYPLGTREDVQREDYESPIGGLFTRAWGRYRQAEVARHEQALVGYQAETSAQQVAGGFTVASADNPWDPSGPALVPNPLFWAEPATHPSLSRHAAENHPNHQNVIQAGSSLSRRANNQTDTANVATPQQQLTSDEALFGQNDHDDTHTHPVSRDASSRRKLPEPILLDDPRRPPATTDSEQLKINAECKVCMVQLVDTVLLPCGHIALCRWCAESDIPKKLLRHPPHPDNTDPEIKRPLCPICKDWVRSKVS